MLTKFGINNTRDQKNGPSVRNGIAAASPTMHTKVITCSCGAKLQKSCENAVVCEISTMKCPRCGKSVK